VNAEERLAHVRKALIREWVSAWKWAGADWKWAEREDEMGLITDIIISGTEALKRAILSAFGDEVDEDRLERARKAAFRVGYERGIVTKVEEWKKCPK